MEEHHHHHWPVIDHNAGIIHGYIPIDHVKLEHHMKHEGVKMEPIDHTAIPVPGVKPEQLTADEQYQRWMAAAAQHHYGGIPQYPQQYHPQHQIEVPHQAIGFA